LLKEVIVMIEILLAVAVLAIVALFCGVLLTLASKYFGVEESELYQNVRDCLPGANCGACGYSGCDGYAKALAEGQTTEANRCTPGGADTAKQIAALLGVEAGSIVSKVAVVSCNGNCGATQKKFEYTGVKTCRNANLTYAGDKMCSYACLGYGDCVNACPENAIEVVDGVAVVDPTKCVGCGICARVCPKGVINMIDEPSRVVVSCSSHDKGAVARKACTNACIACGKCQKVCPNGAITVEDNLAKIDYSKCTGCGECASACPVKCIHEVNLVCGAKFN
jgi:RnfABCDGE-type electron transport complex B subunit